MVIRSNMVICIVSCMFLIYQLLLSQTTVISNQKSEPLEFEVTRDGLTVPRSAKAKVLINHGTCKELEPLLFKRYQVCKYFTKDRSNY